METKTCTKCNTLQNINNFNKSKKYKDGLNTHCKDCVRKYKKEYYLLNVETIKERIKKNSLSNINKKSEYDKIYRELNKNKINKRRHEYYIKNRTRELELSLIHI